MSLRVWSPFHGLDQLQRDVNRLFERNTNDHQELTGDWNPQVDIYEDQEKFLFKVELPGLKANEVQVSLENNILTLSGERKNEFADKKQGQLRVERFYGTFRRSFQLPNTITTIRLTPR